MPIKSAFWWFFTEKLSILSQTTQMPQKGIWVSLRLIWLSRFIISSAGSAISARYSSSSRRWRWCRRKVYGSHTDWFDYSDFIIFFCDFCGFCEKFLFLSQIAQTAQKGIWGSLRLIWLIRFIIFFCDFCGFCEKPPILSQTRAQPRERLQIQHPRNRVGGKH